MADRGTGGKDKVPVVGFLKRDGEVRTEVIPNRRKKTLDGLVRAHVADGSAVYTDSLPSYNDLLSTYMHQVVDHAIEYVRGRVHTNGLEDFWSLLKRTIRGTYVSVEPFHLDRYLDEQAFRYNQRELTDAERLRLVCGNLIGKRLTYRGLIGQADGGQV
jgi:transposase-like protein